MVNTIIAAPNADVLRNRGLLIKVHRLVADPVTGEIKKPVERAVHPDTNEPIYDQKWFKFTNAILAEFELDPPYGFGSIELLSESLGKKVVQTISRVLATVYEFYTIVDGFPVPDWKVGANLTLDGELAEYVMAMQAALNLAQGQDPKACLQWIERKTKEVREEIERQLNAGEENDTPMPPSPVSESNEPSPNGASSEEVSMSSGT